MFRYFSYYGIAAAAVIASWINMLVLGGCLLRTDDYALDRRLLSSCLRLLFAGFFMGGALLFVRPYVMPYFGHQVVLDFSLLSCYIALGLAVYLLFVWVLKGLTVKEFHEAMNRTDIK
ncbi:MAG: polysaccharide biosynthesis C-terminal domain-containing protein [Holosporaceae bacterium]|nr:MAG: polysaccharide biosynthesis C-terminal domain-containing protein [Holosporaceae bacterium]